jgi:RNA polymerase sigma-54 factor
MAQRLVQEQVQRQQQIQRLSAQQMLLVKLLEMPLTELEESIHAEIDDNPALESGEEQGAGSREQEDYEEQGAGSSEQDYDYEREERSDALDEALEGIGRDDEMPDYISTRNNTQSADYEEMVYGDTTSFYDKLQEQVGEHELTEHQRTVLEYVIGSLDDDGLLRKDLDTLSDELAIFHNVDATTADVEEALKLLQSFDPAGIGARSLQECLLLQLERKRGEAPSDTEAIETPQLYDLLHTIITDYFEEFKKKHWHKIQAAMHLTDYQVAEIQKEIRRLNPKPGASLGETEGRNTQQITPDFIVETTDDGHISFYLNQGHIPELYVSESFTEMLAAYKDNKDGLNRQQKEALLYAKEKVDKARGFIDAVTQRRRTLYATMKAIIDWQSPFFLDGDEGDLKPMILKDIADKTGLDISTVSRVSNIKYAQTRWGIFPLKFFFSDGYTTEEGEEMSTRKIKIALKEMIDGEDHKHPMSDDLLAKKMKEKGFPIARRTVAKYREQMGIPVARLRK